MRRRKPGRRNRFEPVELASVADEDFVGLLLRQPLELAAGNLDAVRDWGYAPEYVEGMWRMLQAPEPEDFVLATGRGYSVRELERRAAERTSSVGRDARVTTLTPPALSPELADAETRLRFALATRVSIRPRPNGGGAVVRSRTGIQTLRDRVVQIARKNVH